MGVKRAGWYSYNLLDNLGKKSAIEILDEHQNIQIGDLIPMSPDGKNGRPKQYPAKRAKGSDI